MESGSDCKQGYHSSWFKVGHPGLFASTWNHKSVLQPILRDGAEPVIGRAFARPVGGLLRMRSSLLKHNNLMLRSERRERLEAWAASDSHIAHSRYASRRGCLPGTSPGLAERTSCRYWATVCTTLLSARALTVGSFMSLTRPSSYSTSVCSGALARICTTL